MLIVEYPLTFLYIALGILAFFLILFKINTYLESKDIKAKKTKSENKSNDNKVQENTSSENLDAKVLEDLPGDDKNNYLYDRFVEHPTCEDHVHIKSISDTFITEKDLEDIKNSKTYIRVSPVQKVNCACHLSSDTQEKISQIIDNNRTARSKLLEEFDGLSKEMKLLLIENIMNKKD